MALIKDTTTLKLYLTVNKDFNISDLLPFVKQVEQEVIIPNISKEQYDDLNDEYNDATPTLTTQQQALLEKLQPAIAYLAFSKWIPFGMVQIDNAGIRIASDENMKTAFQWQTDKLEDRALFMGYTFLEQALVFMEENKTDYALWTASDQYDSYKECFINNAIDFEKYYSIGSSRLLFVSMLPVMRKVNDFNIKAAIDIDTYEDILSEIKSGSISNDNKELLNFIKPAVAHLTISRAIQEKAIIIQPNGLIRIKNMGLYSISGYDSATVDTIDALKRQAEHDGQNYLKQLRDYLNKNASDSKYVDYYNSDLYIDLSSDSENIENSTDNGVIGMF